MPNRQKTTKRRRNWRPTGSAGSANSPSRSTWVSKRLIRAFNPWPICHSTLGGEALKVHTATLGEGSGTPGTVLAANKSGLTVACGEGALRLTRLQLPGGKALNFSDLYNSRREQFAVGLVLGA